MYRTSVPGRRSGSQATAQAQRAGSSRRIRRRLAGRRPYCATNGCTSYLEVELGGRAASCPICGYRRRLS